MMVSYKIFFSQITSSNQKYIKMLIRLFNHLAQTWLHCSQSPINQESKSSVLPRPHLNVVASLFWEFSSKIYAGYFTI